MNVYKYVSLASETNRERFIASLNDNKIWLSKYPYLNDPMEGIYYTMDQGDLLKNVAQEKMQLLIGCFGKSARNKLLWAYYTSGYKGYCIEINVNPNYTNSISQVEYISEVDFRNPQEAIIGNAERILTRKLKFWKPENEYRYLERIDVQDKGMRKSIGNITNVYLGINNDRETINYISEHLNHNLPVTWSTVSPIDPVVNHESFQEMTDFHLNHLEHRNRHFEPQQIF